MRSLSPANDPAGAYQWQRTVQHSGGFVLTVRRILAEVIKRCHLTSRSGFTELDREIEKFRTIRDSYKLQSVDSRHKTT
jgi:hypothetical protein